MNLGAENNRFDTIFCNTLDVENGVMGGGGVKQTTLYSGTDKVSTNTTYTISEILVQDSYDYLIAQVTGFNSNQSFATSGTLILQWESNRSTPSWYGAYSFDENSSNTMSGVILVEGNTIKFYPNTASSKVSFQCISSVIGIKYIDPDIKNATSLDETLLYSGTTDIPLDTNGEVPISNLNSYDYVLVKICGICNSVDAITYSIEKLIKLPDDTTNNFNYAWGSNNSITFSGWIKSTNNKITVGLRTRGSSLSTVYIASIIGYKSNSLSTADIAEMAMPSDVYVNIPITNTNWTPNPYIVPANGYIQIGGVASATDGSISLIRNNDNPLGASSSKTHLLSVFAPVTKGTNVDIYVTGVTIENCIFYYCIGDAKALGLI